MKRQHKIPKGYRPLKNHKLVREDDLILGFGQLPWCAHSLPMGAMYFKGMNWPMIRRKKRK